MSQQLISRSAFARLSAAVIGTALLGAGCAPPRQ